MRLLTPTRDGYLPVTDSDSPVDPVLSSLFSYLIVFPLDLIEPYHNPKSLPALLTRSGQYLQRDVWEETLKVAMCPTTQANYSDAIAGAQHLMRHSGTPMFDMGEVYRIVDWLQDIYGAVLETYQKLDNRPYEELLFHRMVMHEAIYLKVYPQLAPR